MFKPGETSSSKYKAKLSLPLSIDSKSSEVLFVLSLLHKCVSLDEPEPVDSVITFLSGYDTLEYYWVKAIAVSMRLRILFVTLQNTNMNPSRP